MVIPLCRLLLKVNHALGANFNVVNMSFRAISENKILANISEFTVLDRHIELDVSDSYRPPDKSA